MSFLDSDDAIYPLLFEEMIRQVEEYHVEMTFCNFIHMDDRKLTEVLAEASQQDPHPRWQIGDGLEAERWFYIDYAAVLCGVSGMVSRELIGPLRFDETMAYGEDTVFKYELFRKQVRTAYSSQQWYYYRTNPKGLSNYVGSLLGEAYFERTVRIRDSEYERGNIKYALARETELSCQFRQTYERCKKRGTKDQCRRMKALALRECGHPLFPSLDLPHKCLFYLCFKCYPLYVPVSLAIGLAWTLKERANT